MKSPTIIIKLGYPGLLIFSKITSNYFIKNSNDENTVVVSGDKDSSVVSMNKNY